MSKQTAVEWLIEQIKEYDFSSRDNTYLIEIPSWIFKEKINKANEMFKQQIINACDAGFDDGCGFIEDIKYKNAEQYYKETYQDTK